MMNLGQLEFSDSNFINYKTDNLAKFLKEINDLK